MSASRRSALRIRGQKLVSMHVNMNQLPSRRHVSRFPANAKSGLTTTEGTASPGRIFLRLTGLVRQSDC